LLNVNIPNASAQWKNAKLCRLGRRHAAEPVITQGERWWARDVQAAMFESAILSEKTALDTARAGLLADIQKRGSVYGG